MIVTDSLKSASKTRRGSFKSATQSQSVEIQEILSVQTRDSLTALYLQMWRNCKQKRYWLNPNTVDKIMCLNENFESTVPQEYPSYGVFYQHFPKQNKGPVRTSRSPIAVHMDTLAPLLWSMAYGYSWLKFVC